MYFIDFKWKTYWKIQDEPMISIPCGKSMTKKAFYCNQLFYKRSMIFKHVQHSWAKILKIIYSMYEYM